MVFEIELLISFYLRQLYHILSLSIYIYIVNPNTKNVLPKINDIFINILFLPLLFLHLFKINEIGKYITIDKNIIIIINLFSYIISNYHHLKYTIYYFKCKIL